MMDKKFQCVRHDVEAAACTAIAAVIIAVFFLRADMSDAQAVVAQPQQHFELDLGTSKEVEAETDSFRRIDVEERSKAAQEVEITPDSEEFDGDASVAKGEDIDDEQFDDIADPVASATAAIIEGRQTSSKPVEQMSKAELESAIESYQTWIYQGGITLYIDLSKLPSGQIENVAELYVLQIEDGLITVSTAGEIGDFYSFRREGKLVIDLPSTQDRWPSALQRTVKTNRFSNKLGSANLILTSPVVLQVYRELAKVQPKAAPEETFRACILPASSDGNFSVSVQRIES